MKNAALSGLLHPRDLKYPALRRSPKAHSLSWATIFYPFGISSAATHSLSSQSTIPISLRQLRNDEIKSIKEIARHLH
jgi:hypothetical protein